MKRNNYASRAGDKLEFALKSFNCDVNGLVCADFGSSTGGFVDCLLQYGARKVYAVETGYGLLDWKLRNDVRVAVMEKTNAVYVELPEKVDLITIDVGWTKQSVILPSAYKNLRDSGRAISLVKLSFEVGKERKEVKNSGSIINQGIIGSDKNQKSERSVKSADLEIERLLQKINANVTACGFSIVESVRSPILGTKGKNIEYLFHLRKFD